MVLSNNITPGMILSINGKLYRVESSVKVTVPKGTPFIKTKLRDLDSHQFQEKNFKLNQTVTDVSLLERHLEFLYPEEEGYLFLDINNLEQVFVPEVVVGKQVNYLREGVDVKAAFYGDSIFAIELPQFLELMVSKMEDGKGETVLAFLETGAEVEVPPFVEVGDIIKVDTRTDEYIQRV